MPLLVIGNKNYSSWSLRPWLLLRHFGVSFDEKRLNLDTPEFFDEIGRWSPTRSVPVLHDDGMVIPDSLAICEYANERWLDGRGWPADLRTRAVARSAAAEMHSGFRALRLQLPMNVRRVPDGYRWDDKAQADIDRIQQLWAQLRREHGGGGDFLCGGFGIVDAMFAPVAMRFLGYGVTMDANARAWVDALLALPAMREWREAAAIEPERIEATDELGSWQQRIIADRNELGAKLEGLEAVLEKFTLVDGPDSELIYRQASAMRAYLDVLNQRIEASQ